MYAEVNPSESKYPFTLYNTEGQVEFADTGTVKAIDGMQKMGSLLYIVSDNKVYKMTTAGVVTQLTGTMTGTIGRVDMSNNGTQMTIIDPDGNGWVATTTTVTSISDADFPTSNAVTYLDGYTIVSVEDSGQFNISGLLNSTAWDALDFATAEEKPDNLVRPYAFNSSLWLFGQESYEVYHNSGDVDFPFEQTSEAVNTTRGLGAKFAVAQDDNALFFLGDDLIFYRGEGYNVTRKSTHAVETAIKSYSVTDDAFCFVINMEGHKFVVLTFPTAQATWVLDLATDFWHERTTILSGVEKRWRANCHATFAGKQLVGDYINGKIYELSPSVYTDDGATIKRVMEGTTEWADGSRFIVDALRLDIDTGVGLTTGQGGDPQVILEFSNDGKKTWSNEAWRSFGKIGEFDKQVLWRTLGQSRQKTYRFTITDPVPVRVSGCYQEARRCAT